MSDSIDAQIDYVGWDAKLGWFDQFALDLRLDVPAMFGNESMDISFVPKADYQVSSIFRNTSRYI